MCTHSPTPASHSIAVILICISRPVERLFAYLRDYLCGLLCILFTILFKNSCWYFSSQLNIREINFGCGLSYRYLFVIWSLFSDSSILVRHWDIIHMPHYLYICHVQLAVRNLFTELCSHYHIDFKTLCCFLKQKCAYWSLFPRPGKHRSVFCL